MFVFYRVKSRKEVEIFKYDIFYREDKNFYLRYGKITPEVQTTGFSINKNIYVKSKGMECIDFEDFIRFIK